MKTRHLRLLLLLPLLLLSCTGKEEKGSKADYITINPTSATSEAGFGHDVVFTATGAKELKAELSDDTWASVEVTSEGGDKYTVTVSLDPNEGKSRTLTLTVTSGSKSANVKITQQSMSSLLADGSELTLKGKEEYVLSIKLPTDWTLEVVDAEGNGSWLEVTPAAGYGGFASDITFKALSLNTAADERVAQAKITLKNGFFILSVKQPSSLPGADFLSSTAYGFYNYDGKGHSVVYDEIEHQYALILGQQNSFRLINPSADKFLEFKGLPSAAKVGDAFEMELFQYWAPGLDTKYKPEVEIVKVSSELVWAIDGDNRGYIYKAL